MVKLTLIVETLSKDYFLLDLDIIIEISLISLTKYTDTLRNRDMFN